MTSFTSADQSLNRYLSEIKKYPVLSKTEEFKLARNIRDQGSQAAAQRLVVCNLRFVVKTAREFQGYGSSLLDMIQEGALGLMAAVGKFDCSKGYRLVTYAVWWIRAYIRRFIMRGWSQVKIGTTQAQRKLFFRVRSERSRADGRAAPGKRATAADLAVSLQVSENDLTSMEQRMAKRDFSLNAPLLFDEGGASHLDMLADDAASPETFCAGQQMRGIVRAKVGELVKQLNQKERHVIAQRILRDNPQTLQAIGAHLKISRERVRQIESNVIRKLRTAVDKDDKILAA